MTDGAIGEDGRGLRAEPIVAFRSWVIKEGWLHSPFITYRWPTATVTAKCVETYAKQMKSRKTGWLRDHVRGHNPPVKDCACGLYAYYSVEHTRYYGIPAVPRVMGAVVCTGRLMAHGQGLRAERLRILALAGRDPNLLNVSLRYGVPMMPVERLEGYAREFGSVLPEEFRGA